MRTLVPFLPFACCLALMGCTLVNVPTYVTLEATETFQQRLRVESAECSRVYFADGSRVSVLDPSTGKIRTVAGFQDMEHIWISPNGEKVLLLEAFERRDDPKMELGDRLWLADFPAGERRLVAETEGDGRLCLWGWLAGGENVVYQERTGTKDTYFIYDSKTGGNREVTEPPFDRLRVRYDRAQSDQRYGRRIIVEMPGGEERVIGRGYDAVLSASGRIAYSSGKDSLTVADLEGNILRRIILDGPASPVAFSPCGRYVLLRDIVEPPGILYATSKLSIADIETGKQVTHLFPYWLPNEFVWVEKGGKAKSGAGGDGEKSESRK